MPSPAEQRAAIADGLNVAPEPDSLGMLGRWSAAKVTEGPNGGVYIEIVPHTGPDDADKGNMTPEISQRLRQNIAGAMATQLGLEPPTAADGAPGDSESPKVRIFVPADKVDEVRATIESNDHSRRPDLGVRKDKHGQTIVRGFTRDADGRVIDPEYSKDLIKAINAARMDGLGMEHDPVYYDTQRAAREAKAQEEHKARGDKLATELGILNNDDPKAAAALEAMLRDDLEKSGKLTSVTVDGTKTGKIDMQYLDSSSPEVQAALTRSFHSQNKTGVAWKTDEQAEREANPAPAEPAPAEPASERPAGERRKAPPESSPPAPSERDMETKPDQQPKPSAERDPAGRDPAPSRSTRDMSESLEGDIKKVQDVTKMIRERLEGGLTKDEYKEITEALSENGKAIHDVRAAGRGADHDKDAEEAFKEFAKASREFALEGQKMLAGKGAERETGGKEIDAELKALIKRVIQMIENLLEGKPIEPERSRDEGRDRDDTGRAPRGKDDKKEEKAADSKVPTAKEFQEAVDRMREAANSGEGLTRDEAKQMQADGVIVQKYLEKNGKDVPGGQEMLDQATQIAKGEFDLTTGKDDALKLAGQYEKFVEERDNKRLNDLTAEVDQIREGGVKFNELEKLEQKAGEIEKNLTEKKERLAGEAPPRELSEAEQNMLKSASAIAHPDDKEKQKDVRTIPELAESLSKENGERATEREEAAKPKEKEGPAAETPAPAEAKPDPRIQQYVAAKEHHYYVTHPTIGDGPLPPEAGLNEIREDAKSKSPAQLQEMTDALNKDSAKFLGQQAERWKSAVLEEKKLLMKLVGEEGPPQLSSSAQDNFEDMRKRGDRGQSGAFIEDRTADRKAYMTALENNYREKNQLEKDAPVPREAYGDLRDKYFDRASDRGENFAAETAALNRETRKLHNAHSHPDHGKKDAPPGDAKGSEEKDPTTSRGREMETAPEPGPSGTVTPTAPAQTGGVVSQDGQEPNATKAATGEKTTEATTAGQSREGSKSAVTEADHHDKSAPVMSGSKGQPGVAQVGGK